MTDAPEPGIYEDVPQQTYRAWNAMNYSRLKHMARSAEDYHYAVTHPKPPNEGMRLGSAVDTLIHEPHEWERLYYVAAKADRRTKAGKEAAAKAEEQAGGREVISAADEALARRCAEAVQSHAAAASLLARGRAQVCVVWHDEETNILCKARLDWVTELELVDLKSDKDAEVHGFAAAGVSYGYPLQTSMYHDGWLAVTGQSLPFTLIVVQNNPPHKVRVRTLGARSIQAGRQAYRQALNDLVVCQRRGVWKEPEVIETFEWPNWYLLQMGVGLPRDDEEIAI